MKSSQESTEGIGLYATRLPPLDSSWEFEETVAVVEISGRVLVEHAHVEVHATENKIRHVYSHIPPGAFTGIYNLGDRRIYGTPRSIAASSRLLR